MIGGVDGVYDIGIFFGEFVVCDVGVEIDQEIEVVFFKEYVMCFVFYLCDVYVWVLYGLCIDFVL